MAQTKDAIWTLPNLLTMGRLLLVPCVAWLLLVRAFEPAFWLFALAALTDLMDGMLARLLDQRTELGAWLDPIADKLMLLTTLGLLVWDGLLPGWLFGLVLGRDAVVVVGALAYRCLTGGLKVAPTWLGKLAIFLEFCLASLVLAEAALVLGLGQAVLPMALATGLMAAASGLHYLWVWTARTREYLRSLRP